jgi:lysophospholipase L1-like esterase
MRRFLPSLLALLLVGDLLAPAVAQEPDERRIAVMGSSVAAGWTTSYEAEGDQRDGWAFRLERLLATRGWSFAHVSVPGDDTGRVLARMDDDLGGTNARFVIVALSLGNEGLGRGDRDEVCARFEHGLEQILARCREMGVSPVLGLCYGKDGFGPQDHERLQQVNVRLQAWDVPTIDFLGAMDDGAGGFPAGTSPDGVHPDDRGHEELFLAVPPSLFEALVAGKPRPERPAARGHVTIVAGGDGAPLSWVPQDVVHPFALAFEVRVAGPGVVVAVLGLDGERTLEVGADGRLRYAPVAGEPVDTRAAVADGAWHHVALSHRHLAGETLLFVDGVLAGRTAERVEPLQLVLGDTAEGGRAPRSADYRDWMVFRSALSAAEVTALREGQVLTGSLEIYAPLADARLEPDAVPENRAWSTAQVRAYPGDAAVAREALARKLAAAAAARALEPVAGPR